MWMSASREALLENPYLLSLSIKSELGGASKLHHRSQYVGRTGGGKERDLLLNTQRWRRKPPASVQKCFPEVIRSFSIVTQTTRRPCVPAWDQVLKAFLLVLHLDFLIFSIATSVYYVASGCHIEKQMFSYIFLKIIWLFKQFPCGYVQQHC